jgi:membrane protease YdiL (CAAX protease family)
MTFNPNFTSFHDRSPLYQLFVSLLIIIVIGAVLFIVFILAGTRIFNLEPGLLSGLPVQAGSEERGFIEYSLFVQDISFFIIPGAIILAKLNPWYGSGILNIKTISIYDIILVVILSVCAFPVTGLAGRLNSGMVLPDWLSGVEQWMKDKEASADNLMDILMTPPGFQDMLLNIIIVAAVPAIGEELIFRGILQKIFKDLFRSGHFAVWFVALLFSAVHFQFYGFLPRFLLGLIFGYLFLWTGNLWLPVTAHFINNAVPTVWAYMDGWKAINEQSPSVVPGQIAMLLVSLLAGILILIYFRRRSAGSRGNNRDLPGYPDNDQ